MKNIVFSRPKRKTPWKIIIVIFTFLLLSGFGFLFPNLLKGTFSTLARPIWLMRDNITKSFSSVTDFFRFKNTIINENLTLKDELTSLKLKQIDYDAIFKENQNLKNQTDKSNNNNRIVSRVLSSPPQSLYDTFIIDNGSLDGVSVGNRVYLSDTIIIGLITSVASRTSVVTLFSTSGQKQEATDSRTGTSFTLSGAGGANFQVVVPKDTDVLVGDIFTYPSRKASVLGSVYFIDANSQSSFKKIYLRIPGNIFSTQWVFVEKN
ncbi:MAG: rod shape-determining protein MreC [Candidatus Zambryskibacteria bacterium]|nr:rod shape-determining protein MreC [Candidatus Zambryskibacteria bacterium]